MQPVAFADPVAPAGGLELDLALEHVAEFFAFVLNHAVAAAAGLDVIDVAGKKMPGSAGNDGFKLHSLAAANLIGLDYRPLAAAQHDVIGIATMLKQTGHRRAERRGDPVDHFQGWVGAAVLDLREERFGTAGGVGEVAQGQSLEQARVLDFRTDPRHRRRLSILPTSFSTANAIQMPSPIV